MKIKSITALYFSPTGNVLSMVRELGNTLSMQLSLPCIHVDITPLNARSFPRSFGADELVIIGFPVYAGRLPNKILPYIQEQLSGDSTPCIAMVSYGNRDFGDGLSELCYECENNGFIPIAAGAMVGEHSFAQALGSGRPDDDDMEELNAFAGDIADGLRQDGGFFPIRPDGNMPPGPYYKPRDEHGNLAQFLKATPMTDMNLCDGCGLCIKNCPMGAIEKSHPSHVTGTCIKCQACVKWCPKRAKYFDNPAFLSHRKMLLENFTDHKGNIFYY